MNQTLDKQYVEARIADFEDRVRGLYATIKDYCEQLPRQDLLEIRQGRILQKRELPMQDADVAPREFPTLSIRHGERELEFVPDCVWIVGAAGRLNVRAGKRNFIVVDLRVGEGLPSRWVVVTSDLRQVHVDLDFDVFSKLLEGRGP